MIKSFELAQLLKIAKFDNTQFYFETLLDKPFCTISTDDIRLHCMERYYPRPNLEDVIYWMNDIFKMHFYYTPVFDGFCISVMNYADVIDKNHTKHFYVDNLSDVNDKLEELLIKYLTIIFL